VLREKVGHSDAIINKYISERGNCLLIYNDLDDADDLQTCLADAKSTYEDCSDECES